MGAKKQNLVDNFSMYAGTREQMRVRYVADQTMGSHPILHVGSDIRFCTDIMNRNPGAFVSTFRILAYD
eukprot:208158-Hanusia_phi.AAC.1